MVDHEDELTKLERAVLDRLLAEAGPGRSRLRSQLESIYVRSRDWTGVGFLTEVAVGDPSNRLQERRTIRIGDVVAKIPGLANDAGFILYVEDGFISALEGYSFDEPWPAETNDFTLVSKSGDHG